MEEMAGVSDQRGAGKIRVLRPGSQAPNVQTGIALAQNSRIAFGDCFDKGPQVKGRRQGMGPTSISLKFK